VLHFIEEKESFFAAVASIIASTGFPVYAFCQWKASVLLQTKPVFAE